MTTSYQPRKEERELAIKVASELGIPYYERKREGLSKMFSRLQRREAIVVTREGVRWEDHQGRRFFFHPNMATLRVQGMAQGREDPLVKVAGLQPGDHVLDCTLGMGADAIVSAVAVGKQGRVVGVESVPAICFLVKHGLKTYQTDDKLLEKGMRSIEVVCGDHRQYLASCKDRSFDVIFFDPMFRETVSASSAMRALKPLANDEPLEIETIEEAVRVARRRVVLKERKKSAEFARLGFQVLWESHTYALGVINVGERRG